MGLVGWLVKEQSSEEDDITRKKIAEREMRQLCYLKLLLQASGDWVCDSDGGNRRGPGESIRRNELTPWSSWSRNSPLHTEPVSSLPC